MAITRTMSGTPLRKPNKYEPDPLAVMLDEYADDVTVSADDDSVSELETDSELDSDPEDADDPEETPEEDPPLESKN